MIELNHRYFTQGRAYTCEYSCIFYISYTAATLMETPTDITKSEPLLEDQPNEMQHVVQNEEGHAELDVDSTPSPKRVRVEQTE